MMFKKEYKIYWNSRSENTVTVIPIPKAFI